MRRYQVCVIALPLLVALAGCESLGIKANIVSFKSMNGKTEVKQREAKNWDEFKSAMNEVGTDFSDVAKEMGSTTTQLVKELVDAPPPGKVTLSALDPGLKQFEGNEKLDFIAAAAKKPDAPYDFTYVQIGVKSYDDFFKAAAETYALAFQLKETGRRIRVACGALTGDKPDDSVKPSELAEKARKVEASDDNRDMAAYFQQLDGVWSLTGQLSIKLAGKIAELVQTGQALITSAPSSITNPKTVLHLKLIVKGLEQSVGLIKDGGKMIGEMI